MSDKTKFLLRNLLRGIIWLVALLLIFLFIKNNVNVEVYQKYSRFLEDEFKVYTIYTLSELFFGIIPPELFMLWALEKGDVYIYINVILILAGISYAAGCVAYFIGRYLNSTLFYRYIRKRFMPKYERLLNTYGVYLIVVASLTPVPYSAICMLVGSAKYPFNKFFLYAIFRFLRYAAYSFIIWETIKL